VLDVPDLFLLMGWLLHLASICYFYPLVAAAGER